MANSLAVNKDESKTNPTDRDHFHHNPVKVVMPTQIIKPEAPGYNNLIQQKRIRKPWWLYIIGIYEIFTLIYNTVAVSIVFSSERKTLLQNMQDKVNVAKVTFIIVAVLLVLIVVFLLAMTILIFAALVMRKVKSQRRCLKWWTFGSFAIIVLDCFAILYIVKDIVENKEKVDLLVPSEIILDIAMALLDILVRALFLYATIKYVSKLTSQIVCSKKDLLRVSTLK